MITSFISIDRYTKTTEKMDSSMTLFVETKLTGIIYSWHAFPHKIALIGYYKEFKQF